MPLVQDQINDLGGVDAPVEVKVFGPDPAKVHQPGQEVAGSSKLEVPAEVNDVKSTCCWAIPNIVVRPDSVQTARVGLTAMDVETQLNAALYGQVASTIPEQDRHDEHPRPLSRRASASIAIPGASCPSA